MGQGSGGPGWEVVDAKPGGEKPAEVEVDDALRSYAEWFVWAKRAGADLSSAHAAAGAAVRASSVGADALAAAQAALRSGTVTAVDQLHQEYSAWFAVASVDLAYEAPKSHVFAGAGVAALHQGMDVKAATAAAEAAVAAPPAPPPAPPAAPVPVAEKTIEATPAAATEPVPVVAETVVPPPAPIAETVPSLPAMPVTPMTPPSPAAPPVAGKTRVEAAIAAAGFAALSGVRRSEAKLVAAAELEAAAGQKFTPDFIAVDLVWVVAMEATTSASGAQLPPTGSVVVMPSDLMQFWFVQSGARVTWPDWLQKLQDRAPR